MVEADLIARSHFTSKADGLSSLGQFLKTIGVLERQFKYEYETGFNARGRKLIWVAESWGGYIDADGNWRVFVAWHCAAAKTTRYVRWLWDAENKCAYDETESYFTS